MTERVASKVAALVRERRYVGRMTERFELSDEEAAALIESALAQQAERIRELESQLGDLTAKHVNTCTRYQERAHQIARLEGALKRVRDHRANFFTGALAGYERAYQTVTRIAADALTPEGGKGK